MLVTQQLAFPDSYKAVNKWPAGREGSTSCGHRGSRLWFVKSFYGCTPNSLRRVVYMVTGKLGQWVLFTHRQPLAVGPSLEAK